MTMTSKVDQAKTSSLVRLLQWCLIFIHVLSGVIALFLLFPLIKPDQKRVHIQRWSSRLLRIFGVELSVMNAQILPEEPYLLAANHISWIDIHAINTFKPIRFVAKSEVEKWPVFGWMAKQLGTVFIKRNSSKHAQKVVGDLTHVLMKESVCIFPEGTSTDGFDVLPFKANLFESAINANVEVYTLLIRYKSADTGLQTKSTAFTGDMTLFESMSRILNDRNLVVELIFLPSLGRGVLCDRKSLAIYSQNLIAQKLKRDLTSAS